MKVTPERSTRKLVAGASITALEASSANGSAEERSTSPRTKMPVAVLSSPQVLGMISGTVYTDASDGRKLFRKNEALTRRADRPGGRCNLKTHPGRLDRPRLPDRAPSDP